MTPPWLFMAISALMLAVSGVFLYYKAERPSNWFSASAVFFLLAALWVSG